MKSGLDLQSVICWELRSGEGGGVRFCYFSFSWSIWFARPCSLNTFLLPFASASAICMSELKSTHAHVAGYMHAYQGLQMLLLLSIVGHVNY